VLTWVASIATLTVATLTSSITALASVARLLAVTAATLKHVQDPAIFANLLRTRVAATATITTSKSCTAATSGARATRISKVYFYPPAIKLLLIHVGNSMVCFLSRSVGDKTKTTGTASVTVTHDNRLNGSTQSKTIDWVR
jgi:hypothetical protein